MKLKLTSFVVSFSIASLILGSFCCSGSDKIDSPKIDTIPLKKSEPFKPEKTDIALQHHQIRTGDGCRLFVKEAGKGEGDPIIFLHGGWGHEHTMIADYFLHQLDIFKEHRLIFYDQRGSMRSPCKYMDSISVQKHVADLERLRKELGIDQFKIVAHSMGSHLAYRYLEKHREHVNGLLGIGSRRLKGNSKNRGKMRKKVKRSLLKRPQYKKALKNNGLNIKRSELTKKQSGLYQKLTMSAVNLYDVSRWKYFKGAFGFNQKAGQEAAKTMKDKWDFKGLVKNLDFKPFFIVGSHDFIKDMSQNYMKTFKSTPNLKLYYLEKAGHAAWIDRPKTIEKIVTKKWLSKK